MSIHDEIEKRIASFAAELEVLVREAAIDAVRSALGRVPAAPTPRPVARPAATPAPVRRRRRKGAKRDPKEIDALTERVGGYIKANPGKRVEEIGKALATPTKELALPIIRLLDSKTIKKNGVKRATKYFPR